MVFSLLHFSGCKIINGGELSPCGRMNLCNADAETRKFHINKLMAGICGFITSAALI
jgi:hypothetical protein